MTITMFYFMQMLWPRFSAVMFTSGLWNESTNYCKLLQKICCSVLFPKSSEKNTLHLFVTAESNDGYHIILK